MIGPITRPEPGSVRSASLLEDPVLQAMAVGVAVVRVSDLTVVDSNPAWRSLFASTDEPQILYSPADSDPETAARPIRRGISRDGHWVGTVRARGDDGTFWCRLSVAPARDEVHRAVWVLTATDVTAEQDAVAEARSAVARQRSEAAALLRVHVFKDEFLTIVSHDLRTPLTAVRGFVDLLRTGRVRSDPAGLEVDARPDGDQPAGHDAAGGPAPLLGHAPVRHGEHRPAAAAARGRGGGRGDPARRPAARPGRAHRRARRPGRAGGPAGAGADAGPAARQRREVLRPRQPDHRRRARPSSPRATPGTRCPRWSSRSSTRAAACGRTGWLRSTSASTPATGPERSAPPRGSAWGSCSATSPCTAAGSTWTAGRTTGTTASFTLPGRPRRD